MNQEYAPTEEIIQQAQYIMETGRLIHDLVSHIIAKHTASISKRSGLNELSMSQFHTVRVTRKEEEVTITRLSAILGVSPPSASAMVDRLVEKGVLTRERSRQDRRKVVVRVSSQAVQEIEKIEGTILRSFVELVEAVGPGATRKWCEALARVKEVLEERDLKIICIEGETK